MSAINSMSHLSMMIIALAKRTTTNGMFLSIPSLTVGSYWPDHCSDYNFVRQGDKCVAAGPEPIPAGVCPGDHDNEQYTGSSGYRLIPGNTCIKKDGVELDKPITKDCSLGKSLCQFIIKTFVHGLLMQPNLRRAMPHIKSCVSSHVIQ